MVISHQLEIEFMNVHTDTLFVVGPFEYVQLTYVDLRIDDGDFFAYYDVDQGLWALVQDDEIYDRFPILEEYRHTMFSDVVIRTYDELGDRE